MYKRRCSCINCGKIGHHSKQCDEPVTSLGIILYRIIDDKINIVMIQRRNSLCYVELLRGRYESSNEKYIVSLLNNITPEEKECLRNPDFDILWDNLWMNQSNKQYRSDYTNSKNKFNKLNICDLLDKSDKSGKVYDTPEWGFPKGRRNFKENDLPCALREFTEETDISINNINVVKNIYPLKEEFLANNSVRYKHIYYLSKIKDTHKNDTLGINPENASQITEVGDIKWFDKVTCLNKLRDTDIIKKKLVEDIFILIERINKDLYLKNYN